MKNLILGFIAGAVVAFSSNALAGEVFEKITVTKTPILSPALKSKIDLPSLAQLTSDQFEVVYGKLDYLGERINELQKTCSLK